MKWRTKTGQVIDIKDMSKEHIKNARAMLQRQISEAETALACLEPWEVGAFTYSETEKWVERAYKYIKAFDKSTPPITNKES